MPFITNPAVDTDDTTYATDNPLTNFGVKRVNPWSYIVLAGKRSPGVIAIDGIRGFDRETGWDKKRGKGTQGAYLTLTTFPPAEGSIEFILWEPQHWDEWDDYLDTLTYKPAKNQSTTAAQALDIVHPALNEIKITKVVVSKVSPITHKGRGMYSRTVEFIEWIPPPAVDVVASTTSSKVDSPPQQNAPFAKNQSVADAEKETNDAFAVDQATSWQE